MPCGPQRRWEGKEYMVLHLHSSSTYPTMGSANASPNFESVHLDYKRLRLDSDSQFVYMIKAFACTDTMTNINIEQNILAKLQGKTVIVTGKSLGS